jgi:hypothetical protein
MSGLAYLQQEAVVHYGEWTAPMIFVLEDH